MQSLANDAEAAAASAARRLLVIGSSLREALKEERIQGGDLKSELRDSNDELDRVKQVCDAQPVHKS